MKSLFEIGAKQTIQASLRDVVFITRQMYQVRSAECDSYNKNLAPTSKSDLI